MDKMGKNARRLIFILLFSFLSSLSTNNQDTAPPFLTFTGVLHCYHLFPLSLPTIHKMSASLSSVLNTSTATATNPVPVPTSLDELVKLLHAELGSNGLDSEGVDVNQVQALMTNYVSNEEDWKKYAHFDKGRYTRNLVDDGNGKFNLMILAWPENVGR